MTIYGSDCNGNGFLLLDSNDVLIGEYIYPVNVEEIYIGEPYIVWTDAGILGGFQAYGMQVRRGDGVIILSDAPRKGQPGHSLTAPANESGTWTMGVPALEYWSSGQWNNYSGGNVNLGKIARYTYSITEITP